MLLWLVSQNSKRQETAKTSGICWHEEQGCPSECPNQEARREEHEDVADVDAQLAL